MRYFGAELDKIRAACSLAAKGLHLAGSLVEPGITTDEIDMRVEGFYRANGGIPAALNYKGFPKSICASINHEVCHGIPGGRVLRDGDIVKLDVAVILDGFYGDTAATFYVGRAPLHLRHLVEVTRASLQKGIEAVRPNIHVGDLGAVITDFASRKGCSVVRDFTGHGVGRQFHEPPAVPHVGFPGAGAALQPGTVFTLEPMVNLGSFEVEVLSDGWTAVTLDGTPSAQFEHTILVTDTGCEVLTARSEVLPRSEDVPWCGRFGAEAAGAFSDYG